MTEAEWLDCTDPAAMLQLLQTRASDRKLRLFACEVCRRMGYRISAHGKEAVEVAERFADGQADDVDLVIASEVHESRHPISSHRNLLQGFMHDLPLICLLTHIGERAGFSLLARLSVQYDGAIILRDIFRYPLHQTESCQSWRTPTALALAETIYPDRRFDLFPVLADALQDAGCDNEDILNHLRSDGPHVRGCWTLDLVLGKE